MINFKVKQQDQTDNHGVFVLEPLTAGFGYTLGSCLRRCYCPVCQGQLITSLKIDGVAHQFSTVPGMSEDVVELILNLKKVRIKLFSDKSAKMSVNVSGKAEVKARDIDTLGTGEIANPDQHLASLNDAKAKLKVELTVDQGEGYILAEDRKSDELGVIPMDSIYSPVLSVNSNVEPTRVGRRTDFDKLTLDITTDGTIKPEEALMQSAQLMSSFFKQVYEPTYDEEIVPAVALVSEDMLKMSVEELDLPVRITNALKAIEVDTVEKLILVPRTQLMKAKNLGGKSLTLIAEKLAERGLSLSEA